MEYYSILLPVAIILLVSKVLEKACKKLGMPAVVGLLLTGIIVGLINYIPGQQILTDTSTEGLGFLAKIGVILIMFSAGLETDAKQIKAVGVPAVLITIAGVVVPMGLGFLVATAFNGGFAGMTKQIFMSNLFYGVILTATSVSVTVATLKELGQLNGKVGSTIVSAAILDDIIGVVVLSFVVSMSGEGASESPLLVLGKTVLFFIFVLICGFLFKKGFDKLEKRWPHHRTIPIFGLSLCFLMAYISEQLFGVADITGAFAAGLILSGNREKDYIDRKSDIMTYMIFSPVFFANIGITTKFDSLDSSMVLFGLCFILAGLAGKVLGCMGMSKLCGYSQRDSFRVGLGMMARAEVALVCAQKGVESGLVHSSIMPFILILIVISSFVTPIMLRQSYKRELKEVKA